MQHTCINYDVVDLIIVFFILKLFDRVVFKNWLVYSKIYLMVCD